MERATEQVKRSCRRVVELSKCVKIDEAKLRVFAGGIANKPVYLKYFDFEDHIGIDSELRTVVAFVFLVDCTNFCFWPSDWEYDNLCRAIKQAMLKKPQYAEPSFLADALTFEEFNKDIFDGKVYPLAMERFRAFKEVGRVIVDHFNGDFLLILERANNDAETLLEIVVTLFLKFQDHCIYEGEQVFFYKRAQILVGDLFGALQQKGGPLQIKDVGRLTCFADYRIPQILRAHEILVYSDELSKIVDGRSELHYGSTQEVEIRAAMIHTVELLKAELESLGVCWTSVEIDWLLWQVGEQKKDEIKPHHRTLSIFY